MRVARWCAVVAALAVLGLLHAAHTTRGDELASHADVASLVEWVQADLQDAPLDLLAEEETVADLSQQEDGADAMMIEAEAEVEDEMDAEAEMEDASEDESFLESEGDASAPAKTTTKAKAAAPKPASKPKAKASKPKRWVAGGKDAVTPPKPKKKAEPRTVRLAPTATKAKFDRFAKRNPKRAKKASLAAFEANRKKIVDLNDKHTGGTRAVFKSDGPFAAIPPTEFKKKFLNTKRPRKGQVATAKTKATKAAPKKAAAPKKTAAPKKAATAKKTAAPKKTTTTKKAAAPKKKAAAPKKKAAAPKKAAPKAKSKAKAKKAGGQALIELGESEPGLPKSGGGGGKTVGGAGKTVKKGGGGVDKSGKTGGVGGGSVDKSGKTGGYGGGGVDKSGKTGGYGGGGVDKSGKTGGYGGGGVDKSGKSGGYGGGGVDKSGKTGGAGGEGVDKSGKSGGYGGGGVDKSGKTGGTGTTQYKLKVNGQTVGGRDGLKLNPKSTDVASKYGNLVDPKTGKVLGNAGVMTKTIDSKYKIKSVVVKPSTVDVNERIVAPDVVGQNNYAAGWKGVTLDDVKKQLTAAGMSQADQEYIFATFKDKAGQLRTDKVVMNQGECGSCWAQTASNSLHFQHQKYFEEAGRPQGEDSTHDRPSIQQLLDCVKTEYSNGCNGGTPMDALDWLTKNPVSSFSEYPMQADGLSGTCRAAPKSRFSHLKGWGWKMAVPDCQVEPCRNQNRHEKQLLNQLTSAIAVPIVYVDATNWQFYRDGLFPVSECSSTLEAGNHVVELHGIGTDAETGVPFWVLRNSWGEEWGMGGFIRLPFGVNACGLANFAIVPGAPSFVDETLYGITAKDAADDGMREEMMCRYHRETNLWYDPNIFKWTATRPESMCPKTIGPHNPNDGLNMYYAQGRFPNGTAIALNPMPAKVVHFTPEELAARAAARKRESDERRLKFEQELRDLEALKAQNDARDAAEAASAARAAQAPASAAAVQALRNTVTPARTYAPPIPEHLQKPYEYKEPEIPEQYRKPYEYKEPSIPEQYRKPAVNEAPKPPASLAPKPVTPPSAVLPRPGVGGSQSTVKPPPSAVLPRAPNGLPSALAANPFMKAHAQPKPPTPPPAFNPFAPRT